jgi:hypothetical protein
MKKGLILIAVLFLPVTIYLIFSLGVPKVMPAPVFGPRTPVLVKTKTGGVKTDTSYYHLPAFSFTTAEGRLLSGSDLKENLYVAAFVEPDSINVLFKHLVQDLRLYKDKWGKVRFMFFERGDSLGHGPAVKTQLLSAFPKGIAQVAYLTPETFDTLRNNHFFVSTPGLKKQPWFNYSDFVLIDREGRIRGYYDMRLASTLKPMREDISHVTFHDEAVKTLEQQNIEQKRKK